MASSGLNKKQNKVDQGVKLFKIGNKDIGKKNGKNKSRAVNKDMLIVHQKT